MNYGDRLMMRDKKLTLGEMRASGVRGVLIYCADYKCSHYRGERRSMVRRNAAVRS